MLKKFSILMLILITSYSCALEKEETSSTFYNYNFTVGSVAIEKYDTMPNDANTQYKHVCVTYKIDPSDIAFTVYSSGKYGTSPANEIKNSELKITGADLYFKEINGPGEINIPMEILKNTEITYNINKNITYNIPSNSPYFAVVGNDYKDYWLTVYITASEISGNGVTTVQNGQFTDTFKLPVRITGNSGACLK